MMSDHLPALFLSHGGGPSFFMDAEKYPYMKGVDKDSPAADNLRNLAKIENITNPKAILVISAHYEESECTVTSSVKPSLLFDYGGFPPETYKLQWPVPGAPEVARRVQELLGAKGITCHLDDQRGLDHGVFVPLMLVYPGADIPGLFIHVISVVCVLAFVTEMPVIILIPLYCLLCCAN
jgi:aromatic ring-opening dioxygenase catalytic subunit (LigB family)